MKHISLVPIFGVMITSPRANVAGLRRGSTTRTTPVTCDTGVGSEGGVTQESEQVGGRTTTTRKFETGANNWEI